MDSIGKGGGINGNIIIQINDTEEHILQKLIEILNNSEKMNCNIDILDENSNFRPETIIIDQKKMEVFSLGEKIELTATEFRILLYLASYPGHVLSHKQIYEAVWEEEYVHDDANVTSHISHIRKKIEPDPNHPIYIQTVRGVGYKFVKQ